MYRSRSGHSHAGLAAAAPRAATMVQARVAVVAPYASAVEKRSVAATRTLPAAGLAVLIPSAAAGPWFAMSQASAVVGCRQCRSASGK